MRQKLLSVAARLSSSRNDRGATATEYGLLVLFIAMAIVLGVTAFGDAINDWYDRMAVDVAAFL